MNHAAKSYTHVKNISLLRLSENIFIFIGLACFSASLFLPAYFTSAENIYGYWILITGWMGLIFIQFAWYANPLNLLALLLYKDKPKIAMLISILALVLASGSFLFYEIPTGINYEKLFIKEFGLGFYLWFVAHVLILLSIFISFLELRQKH